MFERDLRGNSRSSRFLCVISICSLNAINRSVEVWELSIILATSESDRLKYRSMTIGKNALYVFQSFSFVLLIIFNYDSIENKNVYYLGGCA